MQLYDNWNPHSPICSLSSWQLDEIPEELPTWTFSDLEICDHNTSDNAAVTSYREADDDPCVQRQGPSSLGVTSDPAVVCRRLNCTSIVKSIRKQRQNRQAQQRFRQRQKARVKEVEDEAAHALSRLDKLHARQLQLAARNALLEAVADSNFDFESKETSRSLHLIDAHQTVVLTALNNQQRVKTVQDVGQMPFTEFSVLYAAYAKKIHESLRDCAQSPSQASSDALQDMGRWTEGLSRLRVCVAIGNARNFVAFTASRLDGSMGHAASHLSDAWYHSFMATLQLTEEQQEAMMHLRRLFYGKLGALRRHRQQLLQQIPAGPTETEMECDASIRLGAVLSNAQQLEHNSNAELRAYLHMSAYLRLATQQRGILTTKQQALCVVKAFPYSPDKLRMLEVLAARRKEPPGGVLAQPGGLDDFGHHGNWQQLVNHVKGVTKENMHLYIPLAQI